MKLYSLETQGKLLFFLCIVGKVPLLVAKIHDILKKQLNLHKS